MVVEVIYTEAMSLSTLFTTNLYWYGTHAHGPLFWIKKGSFFWHQLISIKDYFQWSTSWQIHSVISISFWEDNWDGCKLNGLFTKVQRHPHPKISLKDAASIITTLLPPP
jgi:hypothetical protein